MYFDVKLQTKDKTYRSVCFSAEKHSTFKQKYEASSPVKITNYNLKRNSTTNSTEIHINKRTRLDDPDTEDVGFDIQAQQATAAPILTDISSVLKHSTAQVSVVGRVSFHGPSETILTKGKLLNKQEAYLTDNSGTIRLVLWENDIARIQSESSYKLTNVMVRKYDNKKYLTLNKQSLITTTQEEFNPQDDAAVQNQILTVQSPATGVKPLNRFLSCSKCHTKVIAVSDKKIIKCSECGLTQLKDKCTTRYFATAEYSNDSGQTVTLKLFEDKLQKLYELQKSQEDVTKAFHDFTDDEMYEMLLTVNATIVYNDNSNVIAVRS